MNKTLPLRVRQKMATEQAIRDVTLRLCAEHGSDGTTVDNIAAEAGISKRTFFRYFDSKESATVPSVAVFRQFFDMHLPGVESLPTAYRALASTLRDLLLSQDEEELDRMQRCFALISRDEGIRNALGSHQAKMVSEIFELLAERVPNSKRFELRLMVNATFALDQTAWVQWCETGDSDRSLDTLLGMQAQALALLGSQFD